MLKFSEYPYSRVDVVAVQNQLKDLVKKIDSCENSDELYDLFMEFDEIKSNVESMSTLSSIRHTINTQDEFYTKENDFYDEMLPVLQEAYITVDKAFLANKNIEGLKQRVPETYFMSKEMEFASFDSCIIEDMQLENKLTSKYQALLASAQIPFDGEVYTLPALEVKTNDKDRSVRKAAMKAYWGWYQEHQEEIGDLYDQMVHVRTKMAKKLGYSSYIELGYKRMKRYDYDQNDVAQYRKQVLEDVVPFDSSLYEKQKERLGYDTLYAWDEKIEFLSGNPTPKHSREEMVKRALNMYKELDPKTGEFFQYMVDHDLLDLDSKKGKAQGGYCTFIPNQKSPFIFANFNQTSHDAEVLTHEAGHAFQVYESQDIKPLDCVWPTYESCEIHSMSMEFFTYPWMKDFFEEDIDKYYFNHLSGAIKFLPYGVLVDHFQHEVYANPDMTPQERMKTWRELEKQYLPHKNYDEIEILEQGGWWMRQSHIFMDPFYYIDYTLAQVCAFQFWVRQQNNDSKAFEDYKHICKIGGTLPFKKIVKEANLIVPFEQGCLKETVEKISTWFDAHQDVK